MKVFLSHSTKGEEFVQRLADALTGAGFAPWLCEVDIDWGDNFVAKIEDGLTESDVALLVWSPEAAKSNWTKEEWTAVLARQVAEQKIRLSIVLLRDHPLPQLLKTKNYIDARVDQRAALREAVECVPGELVRFNAMSHCYTEAKQQFASPIAQWLPDGYVEKQASAWLDPGLFGHVSSSGRQFFRKRQNRP